MGYGYGYMQPQTNVIQVSGEQEARMYQMAPNSVYALWDKNDQVIYYLTSDVTGRVSMQILDFTVRMDAKTAKQELEMNELKSRLAALENMIGGMNHESAIPAKSTATTGNA